METAEVKRSHWPSPIWLVPLLSLIVAAWLLYDQLLQRDVQIEISFENGAGIKSGVELRYRGVPVGSVDEIVLSDDLKTVNVHASLNRDAEKLAREKSKFWIVEPELGIAGARNLDTLVSGKYIAVEPGEGEPEKTFKGLETPPDQQPDLGLKITLVANQLGSLKKGRHIYYRDLEVGTIGESELSQDGRFVEIQAIIKPEYSKLVRTNSKFWNSSGLTVDVGLFKGAEVQASSLENLLRGGISFATPPEAGNLAGPGTRFELHREAEDDWREWAPILKWQG
ncbi:paraquat-inducible protein B [Alcanivorax sp. P2S70]|uniref:MCE family protein n=1 Tax=Alcanivorax profundi TaxID=2338368 RepID=A0A418XYR3_9GAMM|nr:MULTISPECIES: MlaD family protein [Alcanivorax]ERP91481.1 paraquat-inducible protein B [Alcanivorax sp. P2S70]RJG18159.1 MCE family protein [Alcanivorax profundi]